MSTLIELSKPYIQYAYDILEHRIESSHAIYLQCKQFIDRFSRNDMYFDYEDVDKRIRFVSKMKHWTGVHNNKRFELLSWQQFAFAGIFGWKWTNNNYRVTKNALLYLGRKNGKSTLMAAIALIMTTIDGEAGAEVDFIANSAKQANIGFTACRNLSESIDPNKLIYRRYRDSIKVPHTNSLIQVLCSDSMSLDGYNSSCTLIDEFHAAKTWDLYNVMKSSQGMRTQPLTIVCTTAGFLVGDEFPLYQMRKSCISILEGNKTDDTQFSLIYELDEDDDYKDKKNWIKCCPSLGQTVLESYIEEQITAATNQPSLECGVLTKNFNRFCQSNEVWLSDSVIDNVMRPIDLTDFKGEIAYCGIDLGSVSDLTSVCIMFPPNEFRKAYPDKFVFKVFNFVPSSTLNGVNGFRYNKFSKYDTFNVNEGNVTDYDALLECLVHLAQDHNIQSVGYDAWNSSALVIEAEQAGLPMSPYSQSIGAFNRPTKQTQRMILSEKCVIDDDDCLRWAFSNVVLKIDNNENCKPTKTSRENKIDPVIALCTSLGVWLESTGQDVEVV